MNQFIKLFHFELFLRFLRVTKEEKRSIKEKEMNKKNPSRKTRRGVDHEKSTQRVLCKKQCDTELFR